MHEFTCLSGAGGCAHRTWPITIHCLVLLTLCALLTMVAPANAATPFAAVAGQPLVVVAASDVPLENISATEGKVVLVANPKDSKKFDLIYTPDPTNIARTAVVMYTPKGGPTTAATITVQPEKGLWGDAYGPVLSALFALFVVALLLEAALGLLFNWRLFLMVFDAKGAKTFFSFLGALWLVKAFDLDVMQRIVSLLWNPQIQSDWMTVTLSSMVLAGGSSAVNNLMVALGFRSVRTADTLVPKPPATKAWVSVRLTRASLLNEPVTLYLNSSKGGYLGVYRFNGPDRRWPIFKWLMRDPLRFPAWGGFAVEPGVEYQVKLEGPPVIGGKAVSKETGAFTLAAGAILDIEETL